MSRLVINVPPNNPLFITEGDLGTGFSIDETKSKKGRVYHLEDQSKIKTSYSQSDDSQYEILDNEHKVKKKLQLDTELGLSNGFASASVIGDYSSSNNDHKLTIVMTRKVTHKVIEVYLSPPMTKETQAIQDIETLRQQFGLYYIHKIELGGLLEIKVTLESSNIDLLKSIKGEIGGDFSFKLFSAIMKNNTSKHETNNNLELTTSVVATGCSQRNSGINTQTIEGINAIIDGFKLDEQNLVPLRMEICPIPHTSFSHLDHVNFALYKSKLAMVGSNYCEFEKMIVRLARFREDVIEKNLGDPDQTMYYDSLSALAGKVLLLSGRMKNLQNITAKFMKNTLEYIISKEVQPLMAVVEEEISAVKRLIGDIPTTIEKDVWFGPVVDNLPTYYGTYTYNINGSVYKGHCLKGKKHGQGRIDYPPGNKNHFKSIDGLWKDDQVSYPSTICYSDGTSITLNTEQECDRWNDDYKTMSISNCVEFVNRSTAQEYIFNYQVNVDDIQEPLFQSLYNGLKKSVKPGRDRYYFLFLGITGGGKTTMMEYLLNILTGQLDSPKNLRAMDLESTGIGESKTKTVCRYDIEYNQGDFYKFGITLIDTPGFADVEGLTKDSAHMTSILKSVGSVPRIDGVMYVVSGTLTRATTDVLKVLCSVFSILPQDSFKCVSTIFTFCDSANQAAEARAVINSVISGMGKRPDFFLDNPWSQHSNNKVSAGVKANTEGLCGVDNSANLSTRMEATTKSVTDFLIERIRNNEPFSSQAMGNLGNIRKQLLETLNQIDKLMKLIKDNNGILDRLTVEHLDEAIVKARLLTMEEWIKDKGFAIIDGKAKAKMSSRTEWPGGVYATVCLAPNCQNMVCHQGCNLDFTPDKQSNMFTNCKAFRNFKSKVLSIATDTSKECQKCLVCPLGCSHQYHIHSKFQLEWIENNNILDEYDALRQGVDSVSIKAKEIQENNDVLQKQLIERLEEMKKLKDKFATLAVLGDIKAILNVSIKTYEDMRKLLIEKKGTKDEVDSVNDIIETLQTFVSLVDNSDVEKSINDQINLGRQRFNKAWDLVQEKIKLVVP
ncbi:hypothetical protein DFA_07704 [Cavenderia fasciculata]|uniref:G domain-containing protein n=1 Tax=Cavenderia fasciculata TaxID=261658 RepID=F4Q2V0_CACFS|nr:uncharacterized protein DFA_07704 [Cavenderia fasciculata]EGG16726.1 hypothetical protein DFA_07704 [Cavenderia fasciculata]|eukprot:XP_004355200.1 hypothetical protein DFA_07704 [Cavenderia fasciculata]